MTDYESLEILFAEYFKPILKELEIANQLKKDELWLQYNFHVDNLLRAPSGFLAKGFSTITKSWNEK